LDKFESIVLANPRTDHKDFSKIGLTVEAVTAWDMTRPSWGEKIILKDIFG
jgi:hypothetical protein